MNLAAEAYDGFLYALTIGIDARLVYEVGVRRGYSTRAILRALVQTGGRLVSCDVDDCHSAVVDRELRARWTFRQVDSKKFPSLLKKRADMIYVDGSHEPEDVWADVAGLWPLLRVGGLMVLHDTDLEGPGLALDRLRAECEEVFELPFTRRFGLIRRHERDPSRLMEAQ